MSVSQDAKLVQVVVPMLISIKGWLEQVHNLRQRLDPQTAGKRGRATSFNVRDEVEDTFRLYDALLSGQHVAWDIEDPSGPVQVFMARSALSQVLANLVDNAIYWLIRRGHLRAPGIERGTVTGHRLHPPCRDSLEMSLSQITCLRFVHSDTSLRRLCPVSMKVAESQFLCRLSGLSQ